MADRTEYPHLELSKAVRATMSAEPVAGTGGGSEVVALKRVTLNTYEACTQDGAVQVVQRASLDHLPQGLRLSYPLTSKDSVERASVS